jgi:DNA end-binding protein Ku
MKAIWKGALSFGLVHIPVRLYPAVSRHQLHFRLLHKKCKSPVRYKKFCPACKLDLEEEDIVKGYEYQKDKFVLLDDDELSETQAAQENIQIKSFHALSEIDPVYFEKTYFLDAPGGGAKAYGLLLQALTEKGTVAVASFQLRSKNSLCLVRPYGALLSLTTLLYADEIRSPEELSSGPVQATEEELKMAHVLIDELTEPFQPEKYNDEQQLAMEKIISQKLKGQEVVEAPAPGTGQVIDLMEALRESVEATHSTKKRARKK